MNFGFQILLNFFYQYGNGCDVDENEAFEFYSLAVNNEESLNQKFVSSQESDNKSNVLWSLENSYCHCFIILDKRDLSSLLK